MFNFNSLKLVKRCDSDSLSSFVGIRRGQNNELEFRLPHGFDEFPENDFEETKRLFFNMYRTFKKFERDSTREILDQRPVGKDNITKQNHAYFFKDKEDNEVILYSKIALIENLFEAYRELALDVIEWRIGRDECIDYSKIDHYLHRAVYLPHDVIFIDEMDLPRQTLQYESVSLIDLFCFILSELQTELAQETEPRVKELAHRFAEQYLNHDQSLFNEETFETTIQILKDVLDEIDKHTAYKDDDYWRLYEAIELFLYGELDMNKPNEDGIYWGINNFSSVWEDMCFTHYFNLQVNIGYWGHTAIYADTNIIFDGERIANRKSGYLFPIYMLAGIKNVFEFKDVFFLEFRNNKRWMRPDLIIYVNHAGMNFSGFELCDWKYSRLEDFINLTSKTRRDITKQLCYEFCLTKAHRGWDIINGFYIPYFFKDDTEYDWMFVNNKLLNKKLRQNKLDVVKSNFIKIQSVYLSHD